MKIIKNGCCQTIYSSIEEYGEVSRCQEPHPKTFHTVNIYDYDIIFKANIWCMYR